METLEASRLKGSEASNRPAGGPFDLLARLVHGVREKVAVAQARARIARELEGLDDAGLADLGFTRDQIPNVIKAYPSGTALLPRMLAKLGLEAEKLDRPLQNDLSRTCIMCQNHSRCRHWLDADRPADGYREFCMNSWVLDLLREKRARKNVELSRKPS